MKVGGVASNRGGSAQMHLSERIPYRMRELLTRSLRKGMLLRSASRTTPPQLRFRTSKRSDVIWRPLSKDYVREHDGESFRRIDADALNTSDQEQLFLLAYRTVTRELHTTMAVAYYVQRSYEKAVELGLSPGGRPCERGKFAVERIVIAHGIFRYRSYFDEDLLGGRYERVHQESLMYRARNQP
jgi:hypothetical protein